MKLFLDTANIDQIREGAKLGVIDGVTTNPSLIAREGKKFEDVVKEIFDIVDGPISAEVISPNADEMVEDVINGKKLTKTFDMVVLATGMQPSGAAVQVSGLAYTGEGFADAASMKAGITAVGTAKSPLDVARSVQSATGAAIKSIQSLVGGNK